jgi:hypothetical protein
VGIAQDGAVLNQVLALFLARPPEQIEELFDYLVDEWLADEPPTILPASLAALTRVKLGTWQVAAMGSIHEGPWAYTIVWNAADAGASATSPTKKRRRTEENT